MKSVSELICADVALLMYREAWNAYSKEKYGIWDNVWANLRNPLSVVHFMLRRNIIDGSFEPKNRRGWRLPIGGA